MVDVYISGGSNIEAAANIQKAVASLRVEFGELQLSRVYRSPAVGFDGDDFLNLVVGFEEDTPLELIRILAPDVLVKGGDWRVDQIVGADVVTASGGEVRSLSLVEGRSTSDIVARIRERYA